MTAGWFVTGPAGPVGPYDIEAIKVGIAAGGINGSTPVWREGLSSWEPLASVAELAGALEAAPATAAGAAGAAAATAPSSSAAAAATNGTTASRRGAVAAAAPATRAAPAAAAAADGANGASGGGDGDDALAAFQAEISAIEAEAEAAAAPAAAAAAEGDPDGGGAGPATPDELEFEDDDGTWYAWDAALRKYVPRDGGSGGVGVGGGGGGGGGADGAAAAAAAATQYDVEAMTFAGGDDEVLPTLAAARAAEAAAAAAAAAATGAPAASAAAVGGSGDAATDAEAAAAAERKRKRDAIVEEHREKMARREAARKEHEARQQPGGWFELKNNTSVYVTGLPFDATEEEVAAVFAKCGLLKEGPDLKPRVKLYRCREEDGGGLKGDALVTYLKAPSVQLATTLLDGVPLRDGGKPMAVSEAKFEMKGDRYDGKARDGAGGAGGSGSGSGQQQQRPKQKQGGRGGGKRGGGGGRAAQDRLERRLGWGGFDDRLPPERVTVVLSGLFDPRELEATLGAAAELEREVAAECATFGAVERFRLFKAHPAGVATARYATEEAARAAIARLDGRFFAGRRVTAALWDGVTAFHNVRYRETEEEQAARLARFTAEAAAAAEQREAVGGGGGDGDGGEGGDGDADGAQGAAVET